MAVKSRNQMVVVGTIIETNVKYSPDEKSIFDDKIKGAFVKDDFKNPMFRIEVAENEEKMISHAIVDVDMYSIFKQRTKKDSDELIDNETFKALANLFDYDDVHDEWRQVSRGSAGEYQEDEQAGVARLRWRVSV